jgi:hypothetical protein
LLYFGLKRNNLRGIKMKIRRLGDSGDIQNLVYPTVVTPNTEFTISYNIVNTRDMNIIFKAHILDSTGTEIAGTFWTIELPPFGSSETHNDVFSGITTDFTGTLDLYHTCINATKENGLFDVNEDGLVTWLDCLEVWDHRGGQAPYDSKYDMNCDGQVDFRDAGLVWANRDYGECSEITDQYACGLCGCKWYNNSCHAGEQGQQTICDYITNNGGYSNLPITAIMGLIDSFLFQAPPAGGYNFIPTIVNVFGAIDYFLGSNGDQGTGCDFLP